MATAPTEPERVSHYRLVAPIARGSMGQVYRAIDERLGRAVAVKVILPSLGTSVDRQSRLLREAQAASSLNHVGIVTVYDIGAWRGRVFLVMELVDGDPLSDVVVRGVSVEEALRLCALAADALGTAHARGIFHRDIKAANLMRTHDGGVKVLDFGLAKMHGTSDLESSAPSQPGASSPADAKAIEQTLPPDDSDFPGHIIHPAFVSGVEETLPGATQLKVTDPPALTRAGDLIGTPAYMAPELIERQPVDERTEVYALGTVLYELVVGRRPYDRQTIHETVRAIRNAQLPVPSVVAPERAIPEAVDRLLARALARDPAQRPPDMKTFAAELRACLAPKPRLERPASGVYALGGLLVVGAGVGLLQLRSPPGEVSPVTVTSSRRITFDVGCEEYPAFAGDDRHVVYDAPTGDDYEVMGLDLETGVRRQLTHRSGWDYGATVSPDGQRLAYIHMADEGRQLRVLPRGGDEVAPEQTLGIVFGLTAFSANGTLYACAPDGTILTWAPGAATPVAHARLPGGYLARSVVALANGRVFALLQAGQIIDLADAVLGEILPNGELRMLDRNVSLEEAGLAAAPSQAGLYYLRRSPSQLEQLVRYDIATGKSTPVPGGLAPRSGFDISPDGKRLVYSTCGEANYIARLRPDGQAVALTPRGAWRDVDPVGFGEGRMLLTSNRSGQEQVVVLDLASQRVTPFAGVGSHNASPSPDGTRIVFAQRGEGIRIAASDGGDIRMLTNDPSDKEPAFVRDGSAVVFQRTDPEGIHLYWQAVAGGAPKRLTTARSQQPAMSPVEDRIVYVELTGDGMALMTSDLEGRAARIAGVPVGDYMNPRFSRDGKRVLVVRRRTEVVEIVLDGSQVPKVVWATKMDGIYAADYAPDGDGYVASVATWEGDLWVAEGEFR
jgi:serine/threonine protein kinase/Tol biopolymer transport system component